MRRRVLRVAGCRGGAGGPGRSPAALSQGQGQSEGSAPAPAGPVPKTALGHPDLQGIWLDEFQTPLERPAQYADREFLTDEERQQQDDERSGQHRPQPARRARQPAGRRRRVQRRLHVRQADGPPDVARRRSGERPDSGADAADAGAEPARSGIPPGAAAEHRHLQDQGAGVQRRDVRAALAAPRRDVRVLQHAADEPPQRPRGSEPRRPLHARARARLQRVPPHRPGT